MLKAALNGSTNSFFHQQDGKLFGLWDNKKKRRQKQVDVNYVSGSTSVKSNTDAANFCQV